MVEFRSATLADSDAICRLWDSVGIGGGRDVAGQEIASRLENDDGFFVVGERERRLVAVAMGCYDDHRGWMKRVAIDPSQQGRGLGRSLIAEVERRFREAGITKLRLSVWDENVGALSFWRELDYVELHDIHYFTKEL